jgi:hypothetical protein
MGLLHEGEAVDDNKGLFRVFEQSIPYLFFFISMACFLLSNLAFSIREGENRSGSRLLYWTGPRELPSGLHTSRFGSIS